MSYPARGPNRRLGIDGKANAAGADADAVDLAQPVGGAQGTAAA